MEGIKTVTAEEIVDEIFPLMKEYFVASCKKCGDMIELRLLSGQLIVIHVIAQQSL